MGESVRSAASARASGTRHIWAISAFAGAEDVQAGASSSSELKARA